MSDIKISNKLLSWVFGDKCKFTNIKDNKMSFDHLGFTFNLDEYKPILGNDEYCEINIFEFIHLAKIKAFECGYSIDSYHDSVEVVTLEGAVEKIEMHKKDPYSIVETIDCLEWVAEEVGVTK